jgi:D-galactarolactone cycloisomerase
MPPLPGGLHPQEPMLEFDTTDNKFRDALLTVPMDIQGQIAATGRVAIPDAPGIGVTPDPRMLKRFAIDA